MLDVVAYDSVIFKYLQQQENIFNYIIQLVLLDNEQLNKKALERLNLFSDVPVRTVPIPLFHGPSPWSQLSPCLVLPSAFASPKGIDAVCTAEPGH